MRVCLVSREYPTDDHSGGIATYTEKTARAIAGLGHDVHVITEALREPSLRQENGVVIHRLARPNARGLRAVLRSRAVLAELGRLRPEPDIVQACEYRGEAFFYSLRRRPGARLVTRLATPSFMVRELNRNAGAGRLGSAPYTDLMERTQTRRSDAIIGITKAVSDTVCRRWGIPDERVTVIKTGVDFHRRHQAGAPPLPAELSGHEYLLYFGRLEERKGVHVLADALPDVLAAHPRLHAVFAGNPDGYRGRSMRDYVEERNRAHRDRLHFFPRLPQRELFSVLQHALLAVLPSLWEGMGNVSLEALDMGKPVVATLGCGFGEIVEDGRSGLLVRPGDAEALSRALLELVGDRRRLDAMAREAKRRAEAFELTRVAGETVAFYERVLASGPR